MDRLPARQRERVTAWTQQMRHRQALRTVLARFRAAQIAALPVKGITSAHTLYPDIADRLLTDIDLVIRPEDFDRIVGLAANEGWRIHQRMRAYRNIVFVVDGVCVDAQGFVAAPWLSRLSAEAMLARAQPSEALGFSHLIPDFDDHAVLLLLNLYKDKMIHAFTWSIRDVELLPRSVNFDAQRLVQRLEDVGASTIGWIVADWMLRERGAAEWGKVRNAIGLRAPRVTYASSLRWLVGIQPRGALALRLLSRMGADRPVDRVRAMTRMFWWQGEVWASQWGDAPFRRNPAGSLEGTFFDERMRTSKKSE
jgi:hypothetical protein